MNENLLIERIVNVLSDIEDCDTQAVTDFTEKRGDNVIVVGITSTEQLNPGCGVPDYRHNMEILVDCSIPEDDSGDKFYSIIAEIKHRLLPFELNNKQLGSLFGNIPVVYFEFETQNFSVSERSNLCTLRYQIITSY